MSKLVHKKGGIDKTEIIDDKLEHTKLWWLLDLRNQQKNLTNCILNDSFSSYPKLFFLENGFESYYDFYFITISDFKSILNIHESIKIFFFDSIWKEQLKKDWWKIKEIHIRKFAKDLWFYPPLTDCLKNNILSQLESKWIDNLDEFAYIWSRKFQKLFCNNLDIKYFLRQNSKKALNHIYWEEYINLGISFWLRQLEEKSLKNELLSLLKEKDLSLYPNVNRKNFILKVKQNKYFSFYIRRNKLSIEKFSLADMDKFYDYLWIKNKEIDLEKYAKNFLSRNWIYYFCDAKKFKLRDLRKLLFSDKIIAWLIEKRLSIKYAKDFREIHVERFCRISWVKNVVKDINYCEPEIKKFIVEFLSDNWISCTYSLKIRWIKYFKAIFTTKQIWKLARKRFKIYMKKSLWMPWNFELKYSDLEKIWKILELPTLSDTEHKNKLSSYGIYVSNLSSYKIREKKYWSNPHIKYFLEKTWWNHINCTKVTAIDVENMINYINNL